MKVTDGKRAYLIDAREWGKDQEWYDVPDTADDLLIDMVFGLEKAPGTDVWIMTKRQMKDMEEYLNEWANFVDEVTLNWGYGDEPERLNRDYQISTINA